MLPICKDLLDIAAKTFAGGGPEYQTIRRAVKVIEGLGAGGELALAIAENRRPGTWDDLLVLRPALADARRGQDSHPDYQGQYVAISSSGEGRVIASGREYGPVFDAARRQGETIPTVVFVPKDNITYFY